MTMLELPFKLNSDLKVPIYRQLADGLRESILNMDLMPGQIIPSTRELSEMLGVSRSTVIRCYDELLSQGYIETVEGIGTFVSNRMSQSVSPRPGSAATNKAIKLSDYAQRIMVMEPTRLTSADSQELNYGAPPQEMVPVKQWRQVLLENMRNFDIGDHSYLGAPFGYPPVREAIAKYLSRSRAVCCSPEQVTAFSGSLYGAHLVGRILVDRGDKVAVENPGFPYVRQVFLGQGAELVPIPVDEHGIVVDELFKRGQGCRLVYVSPSHQDPTGAVLTLERRRRLLDWADKNDAIIIEDDYDSEYRYSGSPVPSIQGLDENDRVIYLSSFWKSLFPLVNVGYMVVPRGLIPIFWQAQMMRDNTLNTAFPTLEQQTLADFINGGYLERYIRKSQSVYANRWRATITALTKHLKPLATWAKEPAGAHLIVRFNPDIPYPLIMEKAKACGLPLAATCPYYLEGGNNHEFMMPFAAATEQAIEKRIGLFAESLEI
jgi:GntR family transcriptional regulator / MocR family aminotransferase